MEPVHRPVLLDEVTDALAPGIGRPLLIDATVGEGGHSARFLQRFPQLRVVGVDADTEMLGRAAMRLADYGERVTLLHHWFDEFFQEYGRKEHGLEAPPDRVLIDLGISTYHFSGSGRGFSFQADEPLDMRLNAVSDARTAAAIVNDLPQDELADLIFAYGEERYSRRIAERICRERQSQPIETADRLAAIVRAAVPQSYRYGRIHPATRTFQAIRIAVNGELDRIARAIPLILELLPPGGRLAVIAFHSLEDRIVKHQFREAATGGFRLVQKKPIIPTEREIATNPASRSAKLRVIERVEGSAA